MVLCCVRVEWNRSENCAWSAAQEEILHLGDELDTRRRLLLIRRGPGRACIDFIDFNDPVAVDERATSYGKGFDIVTAKRVYKLSAK